MLIRVSIHIYCVYRYTFVFALYLIFGFKSTGLYKNHRDSQTRGIGFVQYDYLQVRKRSATDEIGRVYNMICSRDSDHLCHFSRNAPHPDFLTMPQCLAQTESLW